MGRGHAFRHVTTSIETALGKTVVRNVALLGAEWYLPKERRIMYEAPAIIGTCINCIASGNFTATVTIALIGASIALTAERSKSVRSRLGNNSLAYQAQHHVEALLS